MRDYKIAELSRIQSVVRQQSLALPFMPVFHYLSLSYQLSKMDIQELNALLSDFQINKLLSKNIHHLSGGNGNAFGLLPLLYNYGQAMI
ncbi:hypothetical protein IC611_11790 [Proteus mirabilis]